VWHALTDASDVILKRTTDKKQALKIVDGGYYIIKKFSQSSQGTRMTVTIHIGSHVCKTTSFPYNNKGWRKNSTDWRNLFDNEAGIKASSDSEEIVFTDTEYKVRMEQHHEGGELYVRLCGTVPLTSACCSRTLRKCNNIYEDDAVECENTL